MLVKKKAIAQERNTRQSDDGAGKSVGLGGYEILRTMLFANRKSRNVCARCGKRIYNISLAENVPEIEHIARREVVVKADSELVVVGRSVLRRNKIISTQVWLRIEREQILGNGVDEWELVERKRVAAKFIEDLAVGQRVIVRVDAVAGTIEMAADGYTGAQFTEVPGSFVD